MSNDHTIRQRMYCFFQHSSMAIHAGSKVGNTCLQYLLFQPLLVCTVSAAYCYGDSILPCVHAELYEGTVRISKECCFNWYTIDSSLGCYVVFSHMMKCLAYTECQAGVSSASLADEKRSRLPSPWLPGLLCMVMSNYPCVESPTAVVDDSSSRLEAIQATGSSPPMALILPMSDRSLAARESP